jgi:hypothetical protein
LLYRQQGRSQPRRPVLVCINQLVPVRCLELWSVHVSSTKEEPKKEYFQLGIVAQIAEMEWSSVEFSHG